MAVTDAALIFVVSLLVGTIGILAGARLVVDSDAGVPNALFTAILGAAVWAASSILVDLAPVPVDWVPLLGVLLMLVLWIGVINWRYAGSWGTAAAIAFVAWAVAVGLVYGLAMAGLLAPEALGVPEGAEIPGV